MYVALRLFCTQTKTDKNEIDAGISLYLLAKPYLSAGCLSISISLTFGWTCLTRCGVINLGTSAVGSFCGISRQSL